MTAGKIVPYDMDVYKDEIDAMADSPVDLDKYAALGGMRPGMVAGTKTGLPIPAPEEPLWPAVKRGLFAAGALLAFLLLVASVALLLSALVEGNLS